MSGLRTFKDAEGFLWFEVEPGWVRLNAGGGQTLVWIDGAQASALGVREDPED